MSVPSHEGNIFRGHFDKACPGLDEPSGQKTAESETSRVVCLVGLLGFQAQVEGAGGRRAHESVGAVKGLEELFLLGVEPGRTSPA